MKIGFLALSGVRAHDQKLLEPGLTLPGFVEGSRIIASLPSLGLLYRDEATRRRRKGFFAQFDHETNPA